MRLYLSSFKVGNKPEKLVDLVGNNKRIVIIMNALDHKPEARNYFLLDQTEELLGFGFFVEELDLRNFFNKPDKLREKLSNIGLVWINGGNTFILRRAMKQSGFDLIIKELLQKDTLVYGGFSAAVCVLSSSLEGLEITDDPEVVPNGYDSEIIWGGLNIIDYSVAVHYQSDHPESHLTEKEIDYYKKHNISYKTLRDGEVIIQNGEDVGIIT